MTCVVNTLNAEFLAETREHDIHTGRVTIRQFGEVADSHHDLGTRMASPAIEIATERGRETESDRLEDRIEPMLNAPLCQCLRRSI